MVSPVSGLRSRGGGVVPSGEAGDAASVEALSRRGVPAERDSESCAYGERACDVAVGVYVLVWTALSWMHICVHTLPRRGVNSRRASPPPAPLPPSPLPRTSSICRSRSDLCHSSLLGVAGVANPPGARGSYREESDSERGFRRWEGLEGGTEGMGRAVQGQRSSKCARGTLGCA